MLIGCEKQTSRLWHDMSLTENCYMDDIIRASADKLRSSWPSMHDVAAQNRGKKRGVESSAGPVKKRRYENEKTSFGNRSDIPERLFKQWMCNNFKNGRCNLGNDCRRSHDEAAVEKAKRDIDEWKKNKK